MKGRRNARPRITKASSNGLRFVRRRKNGARSEPKPIFPKPKGDLEAAIQRYVDLIRRSEERYRTLFELVPVAVYACDGEGVIREYNHHAAALWGSKPGSPNTMKKFCGSHRIFYPDGRFMPHAKCPMARALRGEKLKSEELEIIVERMDGERRYVIASPRVLTDTRGEIIGAINCLYDVTDLKRYEAELESKKNELDLVVTQTPFMLTRCGRDLRYRYVSRGYARLVGQTQEAMVGKSIEEILTVEALSIIRPYLEKVLSGKRVDHEALVSYRNGVSRFLRATYLPDRNEHGEVIGWIASLVDLTERRRAEERLRESEELHRAIVNQTVVGMARVDPRSRFVFTNQKFCQMLGYTKTELIGKSIFEITHRDDLKESRRLFRRIIEKGLPYYIEKRYLRKDGTPIWVNVSASALRDAKKRIRGTVAAIVDVGERKAAQAAAEEANLSLESRIQERTQELLAANQELQNQIAVRRRLEQELIQVSEREQRRLGQELHDSLCQHLTAIAFMARTTSVRLREQKEVQPEEVENLAELINEGVSEARTIARGLYPVAMDSAGLVAALQSLVNERTLPVRSRLESDEDISIRDPVVALHLYRIAHEAVLNANKHAQAREIVIRMRVSKGKGRELELSVTDDGVGIGENASRTDGMGIQIMKYRARSVGGRLELGAVKPHGTRVVCRLPLR